MLGLVGATLLLGLLFFFAIRLQPQRLHERLGLWLFGGLLVIQILYLPINHGILSVATKSVPRVDQIKIAGEVEEMGKAWLIWEGPERMAFFIREEHLGTARLRYIQRDHVQRMDVFSYEPFLESVLPVSSESPNSALHRTAPFGRSR